MLLLGHLFTYWPKWVTLFSYSGFLTDDPATYAPTTNPVLKSLWEIVHFLKVRTNWTSSAVLYSRLRKPGYKLIIVLVHSLYFLTYIFRFLNLLSICDIWESRWPTLCGTVHRFPVPSSHTEMPMKAKWQIWIQKEMYWSKQAYLMNTKGDYHKEKLLK